MTQEAVQLSAPDPRLDRGGVPTDGVRDRVVVTLPAASAYVAVLRTTAAALAARVDLTLDDIEDLRIAVDEASALLLADALPDADLRCTFEVTADAVEIEVSVPTAGGREPRRDTFAWTVLTALSGQVDSSTSADGRVALTLTKRRTHESEAR